MTKTFLVKVCAVQMSCTIYKGGSICKVDITVNLCQFRNSLLNGKCRAKAKSQFHLYFEINTVNNLYFRREAGRTSTRPDKLGSFPRLSSPSRSRCDNSGNTLDVEPLLVQSRPWQLKWQKIKQTRDAVTVHLGLIHSTDRNMILFLLQEICYFYFYKK